MLPTTPAGQAGEPSARGTNTGSVGGSVSSDSRRYSRCSASRAQERAVVASRTRLGTALAKYSRSASRRCPKSPRVSATHISGGSRFRISDSPVFSAVLICSNSREFSMPPVFSEPFISSNAAFTRFTIASPPHPLRCWPSQRTEFRPAAWRAPHCGNLR